MISNLLVLDSQWLGTRDLWWVDDPDITIQGYNVYRADDYPANWVKLNTTGVVAGHAYRDQSTLQVVNYTVLPADWVEFGELGRWGFRIPDVPYSEVVQGRPMLATDPKDVVVSLDALQLRPNKVSAIDQEVWLQTQQTLPNGGAVSAADLLPDMQTITTFSVSYKKLVNFVDVFNNQIRQFYTVVPVDSGGNETHAPGALGTPIVDNLSVEVQNYIWAEAIRRNAWIFDQTGEPAYLMFRRWRGTPCGCKNDVDQPRTTCPRCYETGIVGGYYGPVECVYTPPDTGTTVEVTEGGRKVTRVARAYLTTTPIVQNGDMIVRRNGDRLIIANVTYKSPQGSLAQQEFDVELVPSGDTRYQIPVNQNPSVIYNPVLDPVGGENQPVSDPLTQPDKEWENPDSRPVGRTVTFGNIET